MSNNFGAPLPYRPDIDGLRSVAVLSVVVFHAWPGWLPGGFVGVDIFFVISGFLITSIIQKEVSEGIFTLGRFYARRVRRIFPALFIVLATSILFGWFVLLSGEFKQLGKHTAAGAGFISNIVFWGEAGYFDNAAESKPLLHLWSLGIEEQFYIVWPLLIWLLWLRQRTLKGAVIGLTLGSALTCVMAVGDSPEFAFFMPITRFWELTAGGIAAYGVRRFGPLQDGLGAAASLLGSALIVVALVAINSQLVYPGWWTLLPVAGALYILAASPSSAINRMILSARPMVWTGLISYPLYLWHWPLLSFASIIWGVKVPYLAKISLLCAGTLLSIATYRYVERPIRRSKNVRGTVGLLVAGMGIVGAAGVLIAAGAISQRINPGQADIYLAALNDTAFPGPMFVPYRFEHVKFQKVTGHTESLTVFIGDSLIEQYGPRIEALAANSELAIGSAIFATGGGCVPIPDVVALPIFRFPSCRKRIEAAFSLARHSDVTSVVIGAGWYDYFSPHQRNLEFYDGLGHRFTFPDRQAVDGAYGALEVQMSALIQAGKRVYLILPPPMGTLFDPRSMYTGSRFDTIRPAASGGLFKIEEYEAANAAPLKRLRAIANRTGAIVIDPAETLCVDGVCPVVDAQGHPISTDGVHLRPQFVRRSVTYIDQTLIGRSLH